MQVIWTCKRNGAVLVMEVEDEAQGRPSPAHAQKTQFDRTGWILVDGEALCPECKGLA